MKIQTPLGCNITLAPVPEHLFIEHGPGVMLRYHMDTLCDIRGVEVYLSVDNVADLIQGLADEIGRL